MLGTAAPDLMTYVDAALQHRRADRLASIHLGESRLHLSRLARSRHPSTLMAIPGTARLLSTRIPCCSGWSRLQSNGKPSPPPVGTRYQSLRSNSTTSLPPAAQCERATSVKPRPLTIRLTSRPSCPPSGTGYRRPVVRPEDRRQSRARRRRSATSWKSNTW
jgi:hypothetical protein